MQIAQPTAALPAAPFRGQDHQIGGRKRGDQLGDLGHCGGQLMPLPAVDPHLLAARADLHTRAVELESESGHRKPGERAVEVIRGLGEHR
jgi:hypothetical protein